MEHPVHAYIDNRIELIAFDESLQEELLYHG